MFLSYQSWYNTDWLLRIVGFVMIQLINGTDNSAVYLIAQNFDRGKFWHFWHFPARPSNLTCQNYLKAIVFTGVWWKTVTICQNISVKYLKSQYPSVCVCACVRVWVVLSGFYIHPQCHFSVHRGLSMMCVIS